MPTLKIKRKDMVFLAGKWILSVRLILFSLIQGLMGESTLGTGRMENNMEKVSILTKSESSGRVFGIMANGLEMQSK